MQNENKYLNYSERSDEFIANKLGELPENVLYANKVFYKPDTNVFINDTNTWNGKSVDSFRFLFDLLPSSIPFMQYAGDLPRRNIEIWEAEYLTTELANTLLTLNDLSKRVIIPVPGCGEDTAEQLQSYLNNNFGISLNINRCGDGKSAIVVDDVIKTGGTILEQVDKDITQRPDTIYATWALAWFNSKDLEYSKNYQPLKILTNQNQKIYSAIVYAGDGLSRPSLTFPLNSISTLARGDSKSDEVLVSLADKYFGDRLYSAVN